MKKIKDIFYDLNDILVALVIIAVAALIITSNIDSILKYPSVVAAETQVPEEETPTHYAENPPIVDPNGETPVSDDGDAGSAVNDQDSDGLGASDNPVSDEPENYSVYINPGSTGDQIADLFIGIGLFQDRLEFNSAVAAAGAEGRLQAGNFIIPSDSTPAEVISIITN